MASLDIEILPPPQVDASPQIHFNVDPSVSQVRVYSPSAPSMNDFLDREKTTWEPPSDNQQLESCTYSHLGCWVKVPEHLQALHESR
jgi:hypothetical protein